MKFKSFLLLAFAGMFAVAGLTSCNSDSDDPIDDDGEIIAPAIAHNYFGLSADELKTKMAQAKYSLVSANNNYLIFNNNGVEPSMVTFYYENGKMVSVWANVSVNANNKMSHFKKWDAIMYSKKSDFPNYEAHNNDLNKSYTNHNDFVASINEKTKSAVESISNSNLTIDLYIVDHEFTYYFGPIERYKTNHNQN